jgi:hypothetical protein
MSFGAFFSSVYTLLGLAGMVATCAFAWWKGGPPERLGTLMVAGVWLGADLARSFVGEMVPTVILLASDFLISAGFLYVAIRYSSLWLGAAMILQAMSFALHAAQMSDSDAPRWHGWIIYLLISNVLSYLVLLTLSGGTLATVLRRRRLARAKAQTEAKAVERDDGFRVRRPPPAAAI